jgi:hypothetical protein
MPANGSSSPSSALISFVSWLTLERNGTSLYTPQNGFKALEVVLDYWLSVTAYLM